MHLNSTLRVRAAVLVCVKNAKKKSGEVSRHMQDENSNKEMDGSERERGRESLLHMNANVLPHQKKTCLCYSSGYIFSSICKNTWVAAHTYTYYI